MFLLGFETRAFEFQPELVAKERLSPKEIKKQLVAEGFQVFRTLPTELQLAVRVRNNLIMDSGVRVGVDSGQLSIRCLLRSQASDHAGQSTEQGFQNARSIAAAFLNAGYVELGARQRQVEDPSQPGRILDTWHEVELQKANLSWTDLVQELRAALSLPRIAGKSDADESSID